MGKSGKLRVLIADDHFVVRMGIAASINSAPDLEVAGEALHGEHVVELYRELKPDVVLMDLHMPRMTGWEATEAIRAEFPDAKIIILTVRIGDEDIWRSLQAGAQAYLVKTAELDELLGAIRAVARGQFRLQQEVAARLAERMSRPALTEREIQILQLISGGKSNKEIGNILCISEVTVKRHVGHVLEKLQASDRAQAAAIAIRRGMLQLD